MMRVRVVGTGWSGGPGLNTFYFIDPLETVEAANTAVARVHGALSLAVGAFTIPTTFNVSPEVDILDPLTGNVTGTHAAVTMPAVVGTSNFAGGILPAANAILLRLLTNTFNSGRRLQGRAFISPIAGNGFTTTGLPNPAYVTAIQAMGDHLADKGATEVECVVWRRPRAAKVGPPAVTERAGMTGLVTGAAVPAKFAVLRSRRD